MASFDEKVEALRRLQERRQARGRQESEKPAEVKPLDELPAVLAHYAGIQHQPAADNVDSGSKTDNDEADALYCLGHCHEHGLHECSQDLQKAFAYYRQAADQGSTVGQWRLGHLYEYGQAVEPNDELAAEWYRRAAEGGHPHAQSSLALLLEDVRAPALNDGEALHWHRKAAAQGNALSQYCLACSLAQGSADEEDGVTAVSLLRESAAAGFPLALEALEQKQSCNRSVLHEVQNQSVPRNDRKEDGANEISAEDGSSLLDIAARVARQIEHLPDTEAEGFLDALLGSLDDEEIQEMLGGEFNVIAAEGVCN